MWLTWKELTDQWNKIDNLEVDLSVGRNLIFDTDTYTVEERQKFFSTKDIEEPDYLEKKFCLI